MALNEATVAYAPLKVVQVLNNSAGQIDQVAVVLRPGANPGQVKADLAAQLGDELVIVQTVSPRSDIFATIAVQVSLAMVGIIMLLAAAFVIMNAFAMSITARTREIGALRALGMTRRQVMRLVLVEALLTGGIGTLLGLMAGPLLGHALVALLRRAGELFGTTLAVFGEPSVTILDESGVLADASAETRRAVEAQNLGVIMTRLSEMRRNPAIVVTSEDLEGAKIEGGITLFFAYLFPGLTVMFVFFTVGMAGASLLNERKVGTLRRLPAAPIPRGAIIAGKMLAYMLLVCLQVVVLLGVANILFDMPLGQSPVALMLLTLVLALVATAMGIMVAALSRTAKQADNAGTVLGFVLAGIGGCIAMSRTPLARAEGFMGVLSKLTPYAHAVEGYCSLMAENATLVQVLPQIGILLAMAVVFFLIAMWRFKFE